MTERRLGLSLIAFLLATAMAAAQTLGPAPPSAVGMAQPGQIPATATNDAACSTCVGYCVISQSSGTFTATITIASPAVVSGTHNWMGVAAIVFSTTGTLPTGIVAGTTYYTGPLTVPNGAFSIATTAENAIAGTFINTSGTQSGVQTITSLVSLTTGGVINTQGVSLLAGNWELWNYAEYTPAVTTVVSAATAVSISPTTGALAGLSTGSIGRATSSTGDGSSTSLITGPLRLSLAASTTYFGTFRGTFTVSTMVYGAGKLSACRVR